VITAYKVREQTNEQTIEQIPSDDGEPGPMSRIVGPIRAVPPAKVDEGKLAQKPRTPREQAVLDLATWFQGSCAARFDLQPPARKCWAALLTMYDDNVQMVQTVCKEAQARKSKLLTDEHPVWGVHTVLFYARYKRDDPGERQQAKVDENQQRLVKLIKGTLNEDGTVNEERRTAFNNFVAMFELSDADLSECGYRPDVGTAGD